METMLAHKQGSSLPNSITDKIIRKKIKINEDEINGITFKVAETTNELEQAFCLLYEVYVQEGYTDHDCLEMRFTKYNSHPETTVFIGKKGNEVIITCTLFPDSPLGLPMDGLYKTELDMLRNGKKKIAEIGALATHPDYRKGNATLPLMLNKITMNYAIHNLKMDNMVINVRPKHSCMYTSILLFKQIGKLKPCGHVNDELGLAYALDLNDVESNSKKIYSKQPKARNLHHFFFEKESSCITWPQENIPLYVWNFQMLSYFFEYKTNIFSSMSKDILDYVYQQHTFYIDTEFMKMMA